MPCDQIGTVKMIQETAAFLELKKMQNRMLKGKF